MRGILTGLVCVVLLAGVLPAGANHTQTDSGRAIVFDHKTGGNEWWVEVVLGGQDAGAVATLDAMDYAGPWVAMQKTSYGSWSASFHIEPGNPVKFRATWAGGAEQRSCWFSHPQGVEACGGPSPPSPPPSSGFDATFTLVTGNAYWVQSQVTPNSGFTVASVDVRLNDGAWKPLKLQSWGVRAWAASYPIPEGTVVQMRATATTSASDLSECYRWIPPQGNGQNAAVVSCGSTPSPTAWRIAPRATFVESLYDISVGDADRDGKGETYVAGSEGLFKVTPLGRTAISPLTEWVYVAVGDADNDGQAEVFATRGTGGPAHELHRLSYSGTVWTDVVIYSAPNSIGPLTLGDLDYDGKREIYLGEAAGQNATVTQVRHDGTTWQSQRIVDLGNDGRFLSIHDLWVGDGDRDGKPELAATTGGYGYSLVWLIEKGATGWTATRLGSFSDSPQGVVAGDVDGDGLGEVVAANQGGFLFQHRFVGGAWQTQEIQVMSYGTSDIFLGDGDDDGKQEIYAASSNGELYQVRQTPGAYTTTSIALHNAGGHQYGPNIVVVGDGDGDGKREIYTDLFDLAGRTTTLYETQVATTPPPPPPAGFDATFTGVKGNEWWVQATVSGNQPIAKVEARVNCGSTWVALTNEGWGWAKSLHVPNGSKVDFRATSTSGATDLSGGYIWTNATPTGAC